MTEDFTVNATGETLVLNHSPAGELEMPKNLSIVFKGAIRMP